MNDPNDGRGRQTFIGHAQPERTSRQLRRKRQRLDAEGKIDLPSPEPSFDHSRPVYRQKPKGTRWINLTKAKQPDEAELVAALADEENR